MDDTGLYYYGARYYDPTIGRFISPDPFVQRADGFDIVSSPLTVNFIPQGLGDVLASQKDYPAVSLEVPINPQTLNRYSYVLNSPLRYTDPNGWDTKGHGFNINIGFGIGISFEVLKVTDDKGNTGWTITLSFLGTTPNIGGGYQYQETNAETVNDLAGLSGGGGASAKTASENLPSSIEYIGYKKDEPGGWQGFNLGWGPQYVPVEVHATIGWTWVLFSTIGEPGDGNSSASDSSPSLPTEQDNTGSQYDWDWEYYDWEYWYY